ncbi:MAG: type I asparaginase [Clostridia bacterium]|nr:type I asparaginase [Clostridia bacterium]
MKPVLVIYTGGTIGMKKTERGYKPAEGFFSSALRGIPDLYDEGFPEWELYEMSPLLDSSNISVPEWNSIASIIFERRNDFSGFVVLHGTDTMAYSASALSFMLRGLGKPVVFTGSQIPLSALRSDGKDNLITSIMIAGEGVVSEVCLYFGGRLLRGNRAMKVSADGLLAFDSPSFPPLAEAGITIKYNTEVIASSVDDTATPTLSLFSAVPIGVLKIFPGIQFGLFEDIMTEKLSGIVLESFGAGNIPMGEGSLLPIIKKAFASGAVVTVCSQCPSGTVSLGEYETSSELVSAGAVSGHDMTTEAAIAKLYYLFSLGLDKDEIKRKMECNVAGELTERRSL